MQISVTIYKNTTETNYNWYAVYPSVFIQRMLAVVFLQLLTNLTMSKPKPKSLCSQFVHIGVKDSAPSTVAITYIWSIDILMHCKLWIFFLLKEYYVTRSVAQFDMGMEFKNPMVLHPRCAQ